MPYTPTTWVDDDLPAIDASNLNKIEGAINSLYDIVEAADPFPQYPLATEVSTDFSTHVASGDHDARYIRKNTSAPTVVTLSASPSVNVNNTAGMQAWYFYGGTVSNISLDPGAGFSSVQVQNSSNCMVLVPPGYDVTITYTVAPTAVRHNL